MQQLTDEELKAVASSMVMKTKRGYLKKNFAVALLVGVVGMIFLQHGDLGAGIAVIMLILWGFYCLRLKKKLEVEVDVVVRKLKEEGVIYIPEEKRI